MSTKNRVNRGNLITVLELLSDKLTPKEYAKVTSVMSMLFVGHTFDLSDDGFEFVNLCINVKRNYRKKIIKSLQGNVIKLKPKLS
jgi:hypothetical protein